MSSDEAEDLFQSALSEMWHKSCSEFSNTGLFDQTCTTLTQANYNMVKFIITELGVDKDSKILDIACGRGKYAIEIGKMTGCRVTGIDLNEESIKDAGENAVKAGLEHTLTFYTGDMLDLPKDVKSQTFTHVLALGCGFFVHDKMSDFLSQITACTDSTSQLLLQDWNRTNETSLDDIKDLLQHWKYVSPLLTTREYKKELAKAGFEILQYQNNTEMAKRSCLWVIGVAEGMKSETRIVAAHETIKAAYFDGRITYNVIVAKRN